MDGAFSSEGGNDESGKQGRIWVSNWRQPIESSARDCQLEQPQDDREGRQDLQKYNQVIKSNSCSGNATQKGNEQCL